MINDPDSKLYKRKQKKILSELYISTQKDKGNWHYLIQELLDLTNDWVPPVSARQFANLRSSIRHSRWFSCPVIKFRDQPKGHLLNRIFAHFKSGQHVIHVT
jgi:hypothetical protein